MCGVSVVFLPKVLDEPGARASRSHAAEFLAKRLDRLVHSCSGIVDLLLDHSIAPRLSGRCRRLREFGRQVADSCPGVLARSNAHDTLRQAQIKDDQWKGVLHAER